MIPDDPVTAMLAEYYHDLAHAKESTAGCAEEIVVNFRVLVGRYLSRALKKDDHAKIFFCVGYGTPHFWDEYNSQKTSFYTRCADHPERRQAE